MGGVDLQQLGDQVSYLALPLVAVLTLDASAAQMGLLTAAELMPHLLFSLAAGVWIERAADSPAPNDRRRPRAVLLLVSVPLAAAFDLLTFAQLYAVGFAAGTSPCCSTSAGRRSSSASFLDETSSRRTAS